jgi:Flp pilus assembly protein TadG
MLMAVPLLLVLFMVVLALASIWLGRAELQNAVEAAALAGAKVWGDGADSSSNRSAARLAAQALFQANTVVGSTIVIATNDDPTAINSNQSVSGPILFGQLDGNTLYINRTPASTNQRAVVVTGTAAVAPLIQGFGILGTFPVNAQACAYYTGSTPGSGSPQLIRLSAVATN